MVRLPARSWHGLIEIYEQTIGRFGSATLSQLAFPGESYPNFPREKSHWDNTVVKKVFKKTFFFWW